MFTTPQIGEMARWSQHFNNKKTSNNLCPLYMYLVHSKILVGAQDLKTLDGMYPVLKMIVNKSIFNEKKPAE